MTTSALARRGSKCAATACKSHYSHNPPYTSLAAFVRHVHQNVLAKPTTATSRQSPHVTDLSMLWFLAAAGCRRGITNSSISRCQGTRLQQHQPQQHQRRTVCINARARCASQEESAPLNDSARNPFHPRNISKAVDLDAFLKYLDRERSHLGSERIFKSLRSALYNASGYKAATAWRIYQAMEMFEVSDRMTASHFGHLLNILKYGEKDVAVAQMHNVLEHMRRHQIPTSSLHYSQILFAMARSGDAEGALGLLRRMKQEKAPITPSHLTSLALSLRPHHLKSAHHEAAASLMIEAMETEGIVLDNKACAVMVSHLSRTSIERTVRFLESMSSAQVKLEHNVSEGVRYNAHVYTSLISGMAHKGDSTNAERLYREMQSQGVRPTVATKAALLEAYGRAGDFDKAMKILNASKRPSYAMVTSVLSNSIRHGKWEVTQRLANRWLKKVDLSDPRVDDKFRATLLWAQVKASLDGARAFFDTLLVQDKKLVNTVMVNHLVTESGNQRDLENTKSSYGLHKVLDPKHGATLLSDHLYTDALFKCGDVPAALSAFIAMRRHGIPDDITLAMVVRGLVMNNEDSMAWNVFRALKTRGIHLNLYAYTSMLKAFAKKQPSNWISKELSTMWPDIHETLTGIMSGQPPPPPQPSYYILSDPSQAYKLFQEMTGFEKPNEFTYTTLIACFSKHSLARAVDVFTYMCSDGVKPTVQTYTVLLQACSIFRNARVALFVFRHMRDNGVTPNHLTWHYLLKALVRGRMDPKRIDQVGELARKALNVS
ncbi:hypothetical protein BX666DRAFT_1924465 [Dichotomocladium elegans]|nr:hypothetical protein BX666DRAFT_1924465 [Dichotomocladium elegans]